ncbi:MAG: NTP transferase domain-containing protein [Desulfovibrionaceae bacterium]
MKPVAALIPAAGFSTRMGRFKPLLPLAGQSALARCVRCFHDAGVAEIIIVTGHRSELVAAEAKRCGAAVQYNPEHESGMFSSILRGLERIGPDRAVFVLPVDTPLVRAQTVAALLRDWQEHSAAVTYPCFLGDRGHPPLLGPETLPAIRAYDGAGGLRRALLEFEEQSRDVAVPDAGVCFDLDWPGDYKAAQQVAGAGYPQPQECEALWDMHGNPAALRAHCQAVAEVAVRLGRALVAPMRRLGRAALDLHLIRSAALVHDLAKGCPEHARAGAELLRGYGFAAAADIVADHDDLEPPRDGVLKEREIVFLADKLVQGQQTVTVEERYQTSLERYGTDPEAKRSIQARLDRARLVAQCFTRLCGASPDQLVSEVRT